MAITGVFRSQASKILKGSGVALDGKNKWDIQVHDESIFRDTILRGSLGFGDGYIDKKWDSQQLDVMFYKLLSTKKAHIPTIFGLFAVIRAAFFNTQTGRRAFHVGERHYDLGNELYEAMLGESMGYSAGLYLGKTDDLTNAQYNKFDALCRKLELKPGMKLLEIGAGWGTFARHAAKHYGVEVVGLSVSKEQISFAEKRCKGLPVEFLLLDYQKLPSKYDEYFDRVVSIEMIEAVGRKNFRTYFKTVERALKSDGLFGLQAIVGTGRSEAYLRLRIFPNGLVPSQKHIVNNIRGLLRIKKWDSFGTDYDKTLMAWDENFRTQWQQIKKLKDKQGIPLYDEAFYRMWHYYLMICAGSFRAGRNDVAQIIMSKPNSLSAFK